MKKLNLHDASDVNSLVWPAVQNGVDPDLPAVRAFVDFMVHTPSIVHLDESAADAALSMRREHVYLKLVVDSYERFLGIVTLESLDEEEIMKKVAEGAERSGLCVRNFMTPKSVLRTLDYAELAQARLGDVVLALRTEGQRHCLVVDSDQQRVRGIIAASDVSRRFNLPLSVQHRTTFADIFKAVRNTAPGTNIALRTNIAKRSIFSSSLR